MQQIMHVMQVIQSNPLQKQFREGVEILISIISQVAIEILVLIRLPIAGMPNFKMATLPFFRFNRGRDKLQFQFLRA